MKILITGSTGLIGSKLIPLLTSKGHEITRLTRSRSGKSPHEIYWNPDKWEIEAEKLEGHSAVVHLAGENITGRWTPEKKKAIEESRIRGTKLLSESLSGLASRPGVIVAASAVGYYGNRGGEVLTEESGHGKGFLARVSIDWEAALAPVHEAGIRVVNMRIGIVLAKEGGALSKMLTPFRLGLGGRLGNGEQYWSWIAIDDVLSAIYHSLVTDGLSGPVNFTAPGPVTNAEFTEALGSALGRPAVFHVPAFAL
ncbi:MAG TPA: TIGR01777 family oxidoreductase, partial [Thermodesulfobacteriota bacterium]|nr:TIGR01777 family oxidoreductase [Thermodesulfobacteriota bacterium]